MHKRTSHALIENDDAVDVFVQEPVDDPSHARDKRTNILSKQNKFNIRQGGQLRLAKTDDGVVDDETQILLVGDPSQLAALQQMSLDEGFDDAIDTSFEGLNIKIENIEFGWN